MSTSLYLDPVAWDLALDSSANIALASEPYALAQDVANAVRLFQGELWYDTVPGVPYWGQILGKRPPAALIKARVVAAAMTVPGIVSAVCYITSITDRVVRGQVQTTDKSGNVVTTGF